VYPVPSDVRVIELTAPAVSTAIAVAVNPPGVDGADIVTVGIVVPYPDPPLTTTTDLTKPFVRTDPPDLDVPEFSRKVWSGVLNLEIDKAPFASFPFVTDRSCKFAVATANAAIFVAVTAPDLR
jgi:hypothetical protein